jgi:ferredoxin
MAKITFVPAKCEYQVRTGSNLMDIPKIHPDISLNFGCRNGECGTCAIKIISGAENLTKQSEKEKATLHGKGKNERYRLACQCALNGDIVIEC